MAHHRERHAARRDQRLGLGLGAVVWEGPHLITPHDADVHDVPHARLPRRREEHAGHLDVRLGPRGLAGRVDDGVHAAQRLREARAGLKVTLPEGGAGVGVAGQDAHVRAALQGGRQGAAQHAAASGHEDRCHGVASSGAERGRGGVAAFSRRHRAWRIVPRQVSDLPHSLGGGGC